MIKNKKKFIIKLLLVMLWLGIIFFFSNSNSNETTNHSFSVTKAIVVNVLKITNTIKVTNIEINDDNVNKIIEDVHPFIRKLAHFSEYFILSILVLLMIKETRLNYFYSFTIIFCILMAILDETHQLFIDGRSANFVDVLIDSSGSLLYLGINKIYNIIKHK